MDKRLALIPYVWPAVCYIVALLAWCGPGVWAADVSVYTFGRYEIVLQEGAPFAHSEMLGMVRRQTGLPEYPLMLGRQENRLALNIIGPGNRPIQLATAKPSTLRGTGATNWSFLIASSVREGELLRLQVRRAGAPGQATFAIDLRALERLLEGER